MQYMLILTEPEDVVATRNHPDHAGPYWGAWSAYVAAINEAGIVVGGNGLQPAMTATTVRVRDGKRMVQDGPYADTKEQLGGYFIIDVPDLDTAINWASQAPSALVAAVEVRPVLPPPAA